MAPIHVQFWRSSLPTTAQCSTGSVTESAEPKETLMSSSPTAPKKQSSSASTVNVLIIGAGPVGLTLANELVRRGVRTRLVEKLPSIREVSKALILHVRTQEALAKVGIMTAAVAEAEPMREVVVHGYPHSPLTEDHGGSNGPKAGERFLDAHIVLHSDKRTVRLSDLSRGVEWMLLLFTGTHGGRHDEALSKLTTQVSHDCGHLVATHVIVASQPTEADDSAASSVLVDALHEAHAKFGVSAPVIYLVRPDNYIGFRGPLQAVRKLEAYLQRIFGPLP